MVLFVLDEHLTRNPFIRSHRNKGISSLYYFLELTQDTLNIQGRLGVRYYPLPKCNDCFNKESIMKDLNNPSTQSLEDALHQHSIDQCVRELLNCIGSEESYPWKLDAEGNALWIHPIDTDILTRHGVSMSEVKDRIESHTGEHYRVLGIRDHTWPCITTVH